MADPKPFKSFSFFNDWPRFVPILVGVALIGVFFIGLFTGDPTRLPSALIGKPLPHFSLPALPGLVGLSTRAGEAGLSGLSDLPGGTGLTDADLRRGQPVLLNVWASWCGPCRKEHPYLMQLAQDGVLVYGMNYKDAPDAARRFLGRLGNPFAAVGADKDGRVAIDFGVYGVPESFVIDAAGKVAMRHAGPLTPNILESQVLPLLTAGDSQFIAGDAQ